MLEVTHLSKEFQNRLLAGGKIQAVKDVSFSIPQGKTLGIVGNSGCGKSTIARLIAGLIQPDSGQILLDGKDVKSFHTRKQRSRQIQLIFQHPENALDPSMRICDSLLEPLRIHHICKTKEEMESKLAEIMELTHIEEELLSRYPHQISGGEAQRVCLGRMVMLKPKLVILDEPTSMLDVSVQAYIMNLLKELQERQGFTYFIISHDLEVLSWISDEILIMNDGKIIERGEPEKIFSCPEQPFTRNLVEAFTYFDPA